METQAARQPQPGTGKVIAGVIVMVVGLSLLVDRLDWDVRLSGHFWPLILIVIGIARLADGSAACGARRNMRSGLWLVYVGLWGLINEFHLFGLNYGTSWPLLVIGAGVGIVWRALDEPRPRTHRQER